MECAQPHFSRLCKHSQEAFPAGNRVMMPSTLLNEKGKREMSTSESCVESVGLPMKAEKPAGALETWAGFEFATCGRAAAFCCHFLVL